VEQGRGVVELLGFRVQEVSVQQMERPRRRWLQFSLRGLLVLMLVVALGLGWIGYERRRAMRELKTAEEIKAAGGDFGTSSRSDHAAPRWLDLLLGSHYFTPVDSLRFPIGATNEDLRQLSVMRRLERLMLSATRIDDDGLDRVAEMRHLTELNLRSTNVTDAGVDKLAALSELARLDLDATAVTDGVWQTLARMPKLNILSLCDTRTDSELAAAAGLDINALRYFSHLAAPSEEHRHTVLLLEHHGGRFFFNGPEWRRAFDVTVGMRVWHFPNKWHGSVEQLSMLQKVEGLDAVYLLAQSADEPLSVISQLSGLRCLGMITEEASVEGLGAIAELKKLERLSITHMGVLPAGALDFLPELPNLKSLDLGPGRIDVQYLEILKSCESLRELGVSSGSITDKHVAVISELSELRELDIEDSRITSAAVPHLMKLQQLERLDVEDTNLTPADIQKLKTLPKLKYLDD
jgi:internalin A